MIKKDVLKTIIVIADIASLLILAYLILKTYLHFYSCFKLFDISLTIFPLLIIKTAEIILEKYK